MTDRPPGRPPGEEQNGRRNMRRMRTRHRGAAVLAGAIGLILVWSGWRLAAHADGSDVAGKLAESSNVIGLLSGSVDADGGYGDQANADAVPFLGADPTQGIAGLFDKLGPLGG